MIVIASIALRADAVAIVTEDRRTERTREEADRIGTEGCDGCERRIAGSEEHLVEHQRGCRAVDQEVVPLDGGADHTGPDDLAHGRIVGILRRGGDCIEFFCDGHVHSFKRHVQFQARGLVLCRDISRRSPGLLVNFRCCFSRPSAGGGDA